MGKIKNILVGTLILSSMMLTGCSVDEITQSAQDKVNEQVDKATDEVTNQVKKSAEEAVDNKVESMKKSVENKLDPKLGEIRKNMDDIKAASLVYFQINKKMPTADKIAPLFSKSFSDMKIEYKLNDDNKTATISYTGKEYTKEKIPDVLVEPNNQ